MGATITGRSNADRAPLAVMGGKLSCMDYTLPVPSAQVKSAILLAGLMASGRTTVEDPYGSRDHTERLLLHFGARFSKEGHRCMVVGRSPLSSKTVYIPGDLSSAAFLMVGAAIASGSKITIQNVGVNPTRTGIITVLQRMGAQIDISPVETGSHEPVANITICSSQLRGVTVEKELLPSLIDEVPILCIAAAAAEGETIIRGASELRIKESDRIATMARALQAIGVSAQELPDGIRIKGSKKWISGSCITEGDHRVAMAMKIASLRIKGEIAVDDETNINTSFPGFQETLASLQSGGGS